MSRATDAQTAKERLCGLKTVKVNGVRFTIRKINPFLDFPADKVPQMFTDFVSRRKSDVAADQTQHTAQIRRMMEDMKWILLAGIVEPEITDKEDKSRPNTLPVDALLRNVGTAQELYGLIMQHAVNKTSGLRGVFFSLAKRLWPFTR